MVYCMGVSETQVLSLYHILLFTCMCVTLTDLHSVKTYVYEIMTNMSMKLFGVSVFLYSAKNVPEARKNF